MNKEKWRKIWEEVLYGVFGDMLIPSFLAIISVFVTYDSTVRLIGLNSLLVFLREKCFIIVFVLLLWMIISLAHIKFRNKEVASMLEAVFTSFLFLIAIIVFFLVFVMLSSGRLVIFGIFYNF